MLTRNVKNVILFTKVILNSLLTLYLVISETFCNFAAVGSTHPTRPLAVLLLAFHRDALAPSRYSWLCSISYVIYYYYG